ncbi:glycosyltransferase family 4 protein [Rhodanobacter glycinis]|uniref:glycosyltransferase family 4 protein n=1 Tax=Rhodanobacter glycinis TaxID=582702 RepID=UPI001F503C16|nr:glycosyltransferase family 4 protein [Rhodanobacter glycinis]
MRLLFLSKRHPQQRDLIERPYGRFHYLPAALAAFGHEVQVHLCSHTHLPSTQRRFAGVEWTSDDVRTLGPRRIYRKFDQDARAFQPDWVIGVSDTYYGWLAQKLARSTGARLAIDAYDNYEAYMPWNLPLHALWRRSIRAADLVTAAGPQLAQRLQSLRPTGHPVEMLPMAADPEFVPLDKVACRKTLGLPIDASLIGYIGSWSQSRGTEVLLEAFRQARLAKPGLRLVLSGSPPQHALNEPGVIGTGYVADAQLPRLINALDISCVITADTSFGRYSYPAKLCEAMACEVPVIATATEPVRWMLAESREHLVVPDSSEALSKGILEMLARPSADYGDRLTWQMQGEKLESLLNGLR